LRIAVGLVLTLLLAAGCATGGDGRSGGSSRGGASDDGKVATGRPAPEIVVQRLSGKPLALSSLRGRVVLLDVWASWCVPCKQELPMLDAIAGRLRDRGVEVLAVSIDQERGNVTKFLESRSRWALTVAHDPDGVIADRLQPEKMPTSYVIDREGIVRFINSGFEPSDAREIERKLTELAGSGRRPRRPSGSGSGSGSGSESE
jgi:cytochrome c biogenesis protein CcmG, thiol:disulfide interchange protein DsbE